MKSIKVKYNNEEMNFYLDINSCCFYAIEP